MEKVYLGGISKLALTNFRCYQSLRLDNLSQNIIVYGQNGAGKTSILEAISMLSASHGIRGAMPSEIKCSDTVADQWGVAALLDTHNDQVSIGVGNAPSSDQKNAKINGNLVNIAEIEKYLWLLWITPQIDKIFIEQLNVKRKFFDHLVKGLEPKHHIKCLTYKKTISERMKALQTNVGDEVWLSTIEHKIAETSFSIVKARASYCEKFNEISLQYPANFPKIALSLEEDIEVSDLYTDTLIGKLKANREKDRITGITNAGSHRNNWNVSFRNRPLRSENYSTGEQKIMLTSVILTTAKLYTACRAGMPILLFDDTIAHLDGDNCRLFFEEISNIGIQTWTTSTTKPSLSPDFQYIYVKSGVCIQE
ncbi:MAG: AAA family ATPase [Holosporales bacterium]|nr:AAA family ATPase [Holosporales bacterium]